MAACPWHPRKSSSPAREKAHSKERKRENKSSLTTKWTISRSRPTTLFCAADEKLRRKPSKQLWPNISKRTRMRRSLTSSAKSSWRLKKRRRTGLSKNLRSKIRSCQRRKGPVREEVSKIVHPLPIAQTQKSWVSSANHLVPAVTFPLKGGSCLKVSQRRRKIFKLWKYMSKKSLLKRRRSCRKRRMTSNSRACRNRRVTPGSVLPNRRENESSKN